jgi:glycosyltransferase involved in cell wall biosynthesis
VEPFISVIIVSYNYADFLPRALNACANQTFRDFEIVIVNNGSTDNTQDIIDKFCTEHPDMKIVVKVVEKNIGLPNGRNIGMAAATGTYIIFNDADDWMEIDCLEVLAKMANETNADRVTGNFRMLDTNGKVIQVVRYKDGMSPWMVGLLQCVLFRREIFPDDFLLPINLIIEDLYINSLFTLVARKFVHCKKVIYNYFVNPYSTSGARRTYNSNVKIKEIFTYMMDIYRRISNMETRSEIEYVLIKYYYMFFLQYNRYKCYSDVLIDYKSVREIICENLPGYLNCKKLTLFRENGDRKIGRRMTWFLSRLEKYHLMGIALRLYIFLSKFMYLHT